MTLALFDLDNTLIQGDSDHAWNAFLVSKGLVDAEEYEQANAHFYGHYKAGTLDIHEYNRFALRFMSRHEMSYLNELHKNFMQEVIRPIISNKSRQLLQKHRDMGHTLMIITATNRFITEPIAEELGVDHLLAIDFQMQDGRIVAEIDGTPTFREGKVTRLNMWLENNQKTMDGSYFYSDSHNDLPLLENVEHPVAVDPDPTLEKVALDRGWKIISLVD